MSMPASVARSEAKVGPHESDLASRASAPARARPQHLFGLPMSPAMDPSAAVAIMVEHGSGAGAAEARREMLGHLQRVYGNHYAGLVVAELRARETDKTGKPPADPLEPERTQ